MGVLDDAIREHIELKRQHGAGETDLKRQEQEALGPARREASVPATAAADEPLVADADPAAGATESAGEDFAAAPTEVIPFAAGTEPSSDPSAPPDPGPDTPPVDSAQEPDLDEPEEEDVLEETPEFLQETPEHDRLWFEQKPPRDFDFDE